jgi:hypothetical protein
MQIKMSRLILFGVALFLSVFIAEVNAIEVRFLGVETSRGDLYVKQGDEFNKIPITLYSTSDYYQTQAIEGKVFLYQKIETPEGPIFEVVTGGQVPAGAQSLLGIYILAADGQPQLYLYDDDWSKFPRQSYRVINISPVTVSSKIGDDLVRVQSFQSKIVKVSIKTKLPLVRVITAYPDGKNNWHPIYNQSSPLFPAWRMTGIAVVTSGLLDKALDAPVSDVAHGEEKAELRFFCFKDKYGR